MSELTYRGSPTFLGVYERYKDLCISYGGSGWNQETTNRYDIYVREGIVPHLVNHDIKIMSQYTVEDFQKAIEWIERDQEGLWPDHAGNHEKDRYEASLMKYRFLIRAVAYAAAARFLCRKSLLQELEREDWKNGHSVSSGNKDQGMGPRMVVPQSMTEHQEVEFYRHLMQYIKKDEEGVFAGLFLMAACGCRNGESCGANFSGIEEMNDYPGNYCLVIIQSVKADSGEMQVGGKSSNAFRKIPLPDSTVRILEEIYTNRIQRKRGSVDPEEEKNQPIACRHRSDTRCRARDLSEAARDLFQQIGMREDELMEMGRQLFEEQALAEEAGTQEEFQEIEKEPTAYLLRRMMATLLVILGLDKREICLVMGHALDEYKGARRNYLADEQTLMRIKKKLDQRAIFNEVLTKRFFQLNPGNSMSYEGSQPIHLTVPLKNVKAFTVNAASLEPYDTLKIQTEIRSVQGTVGVQFKSETVAQTGDVPKTIDCLEEYRENYLAAGANQIMEEYRR